MARIRIRKNFTFADLLDDVTPTEREMRKAGEELAVKIENRTLRGRDENNQPFAPLAQPKYGSDRSTLHDTSRMFEDFGVVEASRKRFVLGFRSRRSERIAEYHQHGTRRMPARPFLGVPARWVTDLVRALVRRRRRR
jgi:hypothetical protein